MQTANTKQGFTLLELLVVISVIAIIAALLLPLLGRAKKLSNRTVCSSNLRQINLGLRMYSDDSNGATPRTPGTGAQLALNWTGYKRLMKDYVGANSMMSTNSSVFACPADTFFYDLGNGFSFIPESFHNQDASEFSSYAFNGGNAKTNSNAPGIAGRSISSIKHPMRTVLVAEASAFAPWSWHEPKSTTQGQAPMFNNAKNNVSFVDGHIGYIKIHWRGNNPPGSLALHFDPPAGYDYQWSGD